MIKYLRKVIAVLQALLVITTTISSFPFTVTAAEITEDSVGVTSGTTGDCTWTLENDVLTISGNGAMGDYGLNNSSPWQKLEFSEAVIECGVTTIGNYAFYNCRKLKSMTIPDSVKSIGQHAFSSCTRLAPVNIPNSVTKINDGVFSNCCSLTSIFIPESVSSIGAYAFYGCNNLTTVNIPKSVNSISEYAFNGCGLYYIIIPNSITSIKAFSFCDCRNLITAIIPNSVTSIESYAFSNCNQLNSIIIPNSVTSIGYYAFKDCYNLKAVTIPKTVTNIGDKAFGYTFGDNKIADFAITGNRGSTAEIYANNNDFDFIAIEDSSAFQYQALADGTAEITKYIGNGGQIIIPSKLNESLVTQIGDKAFWGCSSLTSATIPKTVTNIGDKAFEYYDSDGENKMDSFTITGYKNSAAEIYAIEHDFDFIAIDDGFEYEILSDNTAKITSFSGKVNELIIPSELDGHTVTSIGYGAFNNCTTLTSVTIPNSVTCIGQSAFSFCLNLRFVTIPNSINSIDYSAFSGCFALTEITIPNSVTSISGFAFSDCPSLTSVTIPDSVSDINHYAFSNCSNLTSLIIPDSVTSISKGAFSGCSSLTSLTIPESVMSIGDCAFCGCQNLVEINIPDSLADIGCDVFKGTKWYTDQPGGVVYAGNVACGYKGELPENTSLKLKTGTVGIASDAFFGLNNLVNIEIPDTVSIIGNNSFTDCTGLTDVTLPGSLKIIGAHAFRGCMGLNSIIIPNSVTNINELAFRNCSSLTSVIIGNSVTSIKDYAFDGCSNLTSLTIPDSVKSIGYNSFYGCNNLSSVTISRFVSDISTKAFGYFKENGEEKKVEGFTIKSSTGSIAETYANKNGFTFIPVVLNNIIAGGTTGKCAWTLDNEGTLTISGNGAMGNYSSSLDVPWKSFEYSDVIIEDGVTNIGNYLCDGNSNLTSVTISNSVTTIGKYAFSKCEKLKSVTIPNSVTTIGYCAFYHCTRLLSVDIPNSVTTIEGSAFKYCILLNKVTIHGSVTSIGAHAFSDCSKITEIIIPNSVKIIGSSAFKGCSGLNSLTIGNSVTTIESLAFAGCNSFTALTIPNSVISIGDSAFSHCSGLTDVTIPDSVTSIGSSPFRNCKNLKNITVDSNNPTYCSIEGNLFNKNRTTLIQYALGKNDEFFKIPESVTIISGLAFEGCDYLKTVTIPNSVTSIGFRAFCYSGLSTVTIPDSVTSLGEYAFKSCSSLESVKLSNSINSINREVFRDCSSLEAVTIPDSVKSISLDAFRGCISLKKVTIPGSVKNIYDNAFSECEDLETIILPDKLANIGERVFEGTKWYNSQPDGIVYVGNIAYGYKGEMPENTTLTLKEGTVGIAVRAFSGLENLVGIEIPDTVKVIGYTAFSGSRNLTSVTIPGSVTIIGSHAFWECAGLTSVIISNAVTNIGAFAFADCTSLTSVNISDSVTSIGQFAFTNCKSLETVTIPELVTSIDMWAFSYCTSLTSVTISNPKTSIGTCAFRECTKLEFLYVPDGMTKIGENAFDKTTWLKLQSEGIVYIGKVAYTYKKGENPVQTITIDEGTVGIAEGAFKDLEDVETIEIPNTIKNISDGAFFGCKKLESITIPNSVTRIGNYTFAYCENLSGITIPGSVTKIGNYAFLNCLLLKSVSIPSSIKSIGKKAFGYSINTTVDNSATFDNLLKIDEFDNEGKLEQIQFEDSKNTIEIKAKENSVAYQYAENNGFEPISYKYVFDWENDNWSFDNELKNFNNAIINFDIIQNLANEFNIDFKEMSGCIKYITGDEEDGNGADWENWEGSCFGMTVAEILVKQGFLDLTNFNTNVQNNGKNNLNAYGNNDDIITIISFLQELLSFDDYKQAERASAVTTNGSSQNSSPSQMDFIKKIYNELKNNDSVILIEYEFREKITHKDTCEYDWASHAVLGYGIEDENKEINGIEYDKRILIADPNFLSKNALDDDACIYYNSENGYWVCPYWNEKPYECYWNGNELDPGQINLLIKYNSLTNPEFYPEVPEEYIAGLTIISNSDIPTLGDGITEYRIADQVKDRKFYALDNTTDCSFSLENASDYHMIMDYENFSYYADIKNGKSAIGKNDGYIKLEGDKAEYSLTIMPDKSNIVNDWYSITVSGENADNVTLSKKENGYLLESNNLDNLKITVKSDIGEITELYSAKEGCNSVFICKTDTDSLVVAYGDKENATELEPIKIGDVNFDGNVTINDVTEIQKHIAELSSLTKNQLVIADTNGDGKVSIADATHLQMYLAVFDVELGKPYNF